MDIAIEAVAAPTVAVRELVAALERELAAFYPPEQRHGLAFDQLFQPGIRFFVASSGGAAVGCGGVALFDGFAEVKRMYVREAARRSGVAAALLARLEREARDAGKVMLRLETGTEQGAAIRFYENCGFRPCAAFGHYAALEPHRIAASLFYEKTL